MFIKLKNYTMHLLGIQANMIKLHVKSKAMTSLKIQGQAYLWMAEVRRHTKLSARLLEPSSQHWVHGGLTGVHHCAFLLIYISYRLFCIYQILHYNNKERGSGVKKVDPNGHQVIRCQSGQDMRPHGDYPWMCLARWNSLTDFSLFFYWHLDQSSSCYPVRVPGLD